MRKHNFITIAVAGLFCLSLAGCSSAPVNNSSASNAETESAKVAVDQDIVAKSKKMVEDSLSAKEGFTPESTGPVAQNPGAQVVFIGADLTNGGINSVAKGVREAADVIGWRTQILDGKASAQGRTEALSQAIALKPKGIILGGFDAKEQATLIKEAADAGIPVVSWHAGPMPGPMDEYSVFTNVTTDADAVAEMSAAFVVADSDGKAGVALLTDRQYDIAVSKSDKMKEYIEKCEGCEILAYENAPIAEADARMPSLVASWLQHYGDKLTYIVGVNGNYFGGAQTALRSAGIAGDGYPKGVAAGDGDAAEFQRIRNHDYQSATIAEPVNLQGWQLVDELNRAMAGVDPSSFVASPGLVTADNIGEGEAFDPPSGYRDVYKKVWGK